jgi:hypothetical protein
VQLLGERFEWKHVDTVAGAQSLATCVYEDAPLYAAERSNRAQSLAARR